MMEIREFVRINDIEINKTILIKAEKELINAYLVGCTPKVLSCASTYHKAFHAIK